MKTRGAERVRERLELKAAYEAGASISTLAAETGHSYNRASTPRSPFHILHRTPRDSP